MLYALFGIDDDWAASIGSAVIVWTAMWTWLGYRIGRWASR
jgi:hypothetical protein